MRGDAKVFMLREELQDLHGTLWGTGSTWTAAVRVWLERAAVPTRRDAAAPVAGYMRPKGPNISKAAKAFEASDSEPSSVARTESIGYLHARFGEF